MMTTPHSIPSSDSRPPGRRMPLCRFELMVEVVPVAAASDSTRVNFVSSQRGGGEGHRLPAPGRASQTAAGSAQVQVASSTGA
jgi:hypothetical protein